MNALLPQPTPEECRQLRKALGLNLEEMAHLAGLAHRQRWVEYESEKMVEKPDAYRWTLLMLNLDLHPTMRMVPRPAPLRINLAEEVEQTRQAHSAG